MSNTSDIAGILEKAFARDPCEDTPRPSSRFRGRYVSLFKNKLGDTGAIDLVAHLNLKKNQDVTNLCIGSCNIGDEGAIALAKALKDNETLLKLEIHCNLFGDEGAIAFAEMLKVNTTLKTLNLYGNKIGDKGAKALANALKVNKTLTHFYIGCNNIGDVGADNIADMLKVNRTLNLLDIHSNKIGNDGMEKIAEGIKGNLHLFTIKISGNIISKKIQDQIIIIQNNKNKLSLSGLSIITLLSKTSFDENDLDKVPAQYQPVVKKMLEILENGDPVEPPYTTIWNNLHSIGYK
jgi:Ran GTPase-activating protein (RanGAP) involved in mRNA processing and transport